MCTLKPLWNITQLTVHRSDQNLTWYFLSNLTLAKASTFQNTSSVQPHFPKSILSSNSCTDAFPGQIRETVCKLTSLPASNPASQVTGDVWQWEGHHTCASHYSGKMEDSLKRLSLLDPLCRCLYTHSGWEEPERSIQYHLHLKYSSCSTYDSKTRTRLHRRLILTMQVTNLSTQFPPEHFSCFFLKEACYSIKVPQRAGTELTHSPDAAPPCTYSRLHTLARRRCLLIAILLTVARNGIRLADHQLMNG